MLLLLYKKIFEVNNLTEGRGTREVASSLVYEQKNKKINFLSLFYLGFKIFNMTNKYRAYTNK